MEAQLEKMFRKQFPVDEDADALTDNGGHKQDTTDMIMA